MNAGLVHTHLSAFEHHKMCGYKGYRLCSEHLLTLRRLQGAGHLEKDFALKRLVLFGATGRSMSELHGC